MIVSVWLNAFIPRDVPGLTKTVPAGQHEGKTMLPGPMPINDCFLTDQRGFSNAPTARSRMHSKATIDITTKKMIQSHRCDPTTEIDCEDGDEECVSTAPKHRMRFSDPRIDPSGKLFEFTLDGAASNPCFRGSPDIRCVLRIAVDLRRVPTGFTAAVAVAGSICLFPAFEMYASAGGDPGVPLFQLMPLSGRTPGDLFDGPVRPVTAMVILC